MTTFSNILLENTSDIDIREFALEYNRAYVDYVYESADSIVLERKNEDEQLTSSEKKSFSNFLKKIIEAFKSLVRRICKKFKNITKKPMDKKEIKDSKAFKKQRRYTYKQLEDQMYTDLSKGKKLLRKIESNTGVSEEEIENFCNSSIKFFDKNKKEIAASSIALVGITDVESRLLKVERDFNNAVSNVRVNTYDQRTKAQRVTDALMLRLSNAMLLINLADIEY